MLTSAENNMYQKNKTIFHLDKPGPVFYIWLCKERENTPDSKIHGANMGTIWVLSAPDGPHVTCY